MGRVITGRPVSVGPVNLEITRELGSSRAPDGLSVGEGVAGQRRHAVLEFFGIFRWPTRHAFRPQIRRYVRRIRIGRIKKGVPEDILGQDQRLGAHHRAEVPELAEGQAGKGLAVVVIEALAQQCSSRGAGLDLPIQVVDRRAAVVQNIS